MPEEARLRDPNCAACGAPIYAGSHVVYSQGELVHLHCSGGDPVAYEAVAAFFERTHERACHTCLATTLGIPLDQVRKAITALRLGGAVVVAVARCGYCGAERVTTRAGAKGQNPA